MEAATTNRQIAAWLQEHSLELPLGGAHSIADLEPLRAILSRVRVVGFGDATHGTKEFCAIRQRLLEFLVTEMAFTVLAIEASKTASTRINAYILDGDGDRASALAELAFPMWDVDEFAATLEWLRSYNATLPDSRRVRFHGLDIWNTGPSRARVLAYLRRVAPEMLVGTEELFRAVARSEARGMLVAHEHIDAQLLARVQELDEYIARRREPFIGRTSESEHGAVRDHLRVIRQWVAANLADELEDELPPGLPRQPGLNNHARSVYMADNLIDILTKHEPDAKAIVWAHVFHVAVGFPAREHRAPNMGDSLRKRLGEGYYAFALELDHGTYLAREWLPDDTLGDLKVASIPPAVTGSLAWHLTRTGRAAFMLDLRRSPRSPPIDRWLTAPQLVHTVSWLWREPATPYTKLAIADACDGLVFVEDTSATAPTENAVRAVRARVGH